MTAFTAAGFTAVVNPAAGRGTGMATAAAVAGAMPPGSVEIVASRDPGHARDLAWMAAERNRAVLAVGGDGHAGCVAGAVVAAGGVLGLVPVGRGNDFARQLGVPREPHALATTLTSGTVRTVDVLDAGGRTVLGSVYAGVDSAATAIVNSRPRVPGALVYRYAALRALLTFRPAGFRMLLDGVEWSERAYCVVVANSGFYGAGMHIVPTAAVDDGELDVLLIRDTSRWRLIASMREVYAGTHVDRPDVEVRRARTVELAIDRPVPFYADGEPLPAPPVKGRPPAVAEPAMVVTLVPSALRVLAPG